LKGDPEMKFNEILPVGVSICVLILVALLQRQSKVVAAITATMPVTIPLVLWIVYTSTKGERKPIEQFTGGLVSGIVPTVAFVLAIWLGTRFGLKLVPTILVGYLTWGLTLGMMLAVRRWMGV
jgi:hypothetical protein